VLAVSKLADGKTEADALAWAIKPQGPPPMTHLGGPVVGPGASNSFVAKLTKGTYFFYCPVPVRGDPARTPHVAKGMHKTVTIT
jgi:hypothetical protein